MPILASLSKHDPKAVDMRHPLTSLSDWVDKDSPN